MCYQGTDGGTGKFSSEHRGWTYIFQNLKLGDIWK